MRSSRFRLRSVMVAVALAAIALGGWRAHRLAVLSSGYASMARTIRAMSSGFRAQAEDPNTSPELKSEWLARVAELEAVARIYERAASRPWLPVTFEAESP